MKFSMRFMRLSILGSLAVANLGRAQNDNMKERADRLRAWQVVPEEFRALAVTTNEQIRRANESQVLVGETSHEISNAIGDFFSLGSAAFSAFPAVNTLSGLTSAQYGAGLGVVGTFGAGGAFSNLFGAADRAKAHGELLDAEVAVALDIRYGNGTMATSFSSEMLAGKLPEYLENAHLQMPLDQNEITKDFYEIPKGLRPILESALIRRLAGDSKVLEDRVKKLEENRAQNEPLSYSEKDLERARFILFKIYAEARFDAAAKILQDEGVASAVSENEIIRRESIRLSQEGYSPSLSSGDQISRQQGDSLDTGSPTSNRIANSTHLNPGMQEPTNMDRQRSERLMREIQTMTMAANAIIDSAVYFGDIPADDARKLRAGITMLAGAAMTVVGIVSPPNPLLIVSGVTSFLGGITAMFSDPKAEADPIMEALRAIAKDLDNRLAELRVNIYELRVAVSKSHHDIILTLNREFSIVKSGLGTIEQTLLVQQYATFLGNCGVFNERLNAAISESKLSTDEVLTNPVKFENELTPRTSVELAQQWNACFDGLSKAILAHEGDLSRSPFTYSAENGRDPLNSAEEKQSVQRHFQDSFALLAANAGSLFGPDVTFEMLVSSMAYRSLNVISLLEKKREVAHFRLPRNHSADQFETLLSPGVIHGVADHLYALASFAPSISEKGWLGNTNQLPPTIARQTVSPGTSGLFHQNLESMLNPLTLSLAQQSLLTGDLFLFTLDKLYQARLDRVSDCYKQSAFCLDSSTPDEAKFFRVLQGDRRLAANFFTFRLMTNFEAPPDNQVSSERTSEAALDAYQRAYLAGNAQVLSAWLKTRMVFGDQWMPSQTVDIRCWQENDYFKKMSEPWQALEANHEAIETGAVPKDSPGAQRLSEANDNLQTQIDNLRKSAKSRRQNCSAPETAASGELGYKWYAQLPATGSYFPLPLPQDLRAGGKLYSSLPYNTLAEDDRRLMAEKDDLEATSILDKETITKIKEFKSSINPR